MPGEMSQVNGDRIGYAAAIQFARTGGHAALGVGYRLTEEAHWPHRCIIAKPPSAGFVLTQRSSTTIPSS